MKSPGRYVEGIGKFFCHVPGNSPFAALNLGNTGLGNAKTCGKLLLGDVFLHAKAANNFTRMSVRKYVFKAKQGFVIFIDILNLMPGNFAL